MRTILLLIPCLLSIAVPLFDRDEPRLLGFPFFYWYLFVLVPASALFVYAAFRIDRSGGKA